MPPRGSLPFPGKGDEFVSSGTHALDTPRFFERIVVETTVRRIPIPCRYGSDLQCASASKTKTLLPMCNAEENMALASSSSVKVLKGAICMDGLRPAASWIVVISVCLGYLFPGNLKRPGKGQCDD